MSPTRRKFIHTAIPVTPARSGAIRPDQKFILLKMPINELGASFFDSLTCRR